MASEPSDRTSDNPGDLDRGDPRADRPALMVVDEVGRLLDAQLDLAKLVQAITDISTKLIGADFGAFCYNFLSNEGQSYALHSLAGTAKGSEAHPSLPRITAMFRPTFPGPGVVRIDDVAEDPSSTTSPPYFGMPDVQFPVRSYLAVPVSSRSGETLGGLYFGHPDPERFNIDHERLLAGIARHAAVALDNARLYDRARVGDLASTRLAAIVQSSDDAIISKNLDGIVQSWNAGAERMFGYTAAEMIGRSITVLFPPDRVDEEPGILARLRSGERVDHFETIRRRKDGGLINVSVSISPIRDAVGRIVGASKVARDITERTRSEAEREKLLAAERAARSEAERHSRIKDEFLATLGHELRTPLNAMLGWASLLKSRTIADDEITHGLAVIERNARLQAQLIEDLLDMSRIISGKLRLTVQPVDLAPVIQAAIESVRPAAEAKQVALSHRFDTNAGPVSGDPNRLQQVFWNILTNAVKFTPKGGRVLVSLARVNSHVEVSVADSGEGISPEFLPMVFDRFRQADASTTRRHGGLGLGLAIVKHLVELHGGTVRAGSPGVGQGATFSVALPVRAMRELAPGGPDPASTQRQSAAYEISLAGLRAIVVDDEADARELIRRVLEQAGAQVRTAGSAAEAFSALREQPPDILLSDIGMPDEDGYSLVRRLRSLSKIEGGEVPAVALTAFARTEDRRRALLSGFQMHVPKPVEAAELLAVVASLTRRV